MFKKIFSILLVFLLCCSTSIILFAQTKPSRVEETEIIDPTSVSSDYVMTVNVDSEYLEWLLGVPDEIVSASTIELLEYFLESPFVGQQIYSCSSSFEEREIDFSCHEAFRELISREDFMEALENYAESILCSLKSSERDRAAFEKLLAQPHVESLISDSEHIATSYPNLRSIYTTSEIVP